jgi:aryl-alcohol dehydrogenase-like predicted oxidoreductase
MIPRQEFGSTGHKSSRTIFGAFAIAYSSQEEANDTLKLLQKYGVNHIDTARSYGESEVLIGNWIKKYRNSFFLATKTGERTYDNAKKEIMESLRRLQVKKFDLLQLHNLVHPDDWDLAFSDSGALKAAVEARDQGLTRFIGVSGHGLMSASMHLRSLGRFEFDSVLLPLNYVLWKRERYRKDVKKLLKVCEEKGVAVQTIKSLTRGPWARTTRNRTTWYEPLEEQEDIDLAVSWLLGNEGVYLNTIGDRNILPKVLDAANRFNGKPSNDEMNKLVSDKRMTDLFVS